MANKSQKRIELEAEYKKLADTANHRLLELEKLSKRPGYENVLNYAYRTAQKDVQLYNTRIKSNKVRFRKPKNTNQLEAAIRDVKKFLNAPSSSVRGIKSIYKTGAENFNKNFHTNFTWQELANFTEKVDFESLKQKYGSPVLVMIIRSIKDNKVTSKDIKAFNIIHKTMTGDEIEDELITRLYDEGITPESLKGTGEYEDEWIDLDNYSPFI